MTQTPHKASPPHKVTRPEDDWHEARLIPTTGIGGQEDQEQRATSALLAVLHAVPEFGRAILSTVGAPTGRINAYIEVRFPDETGTAPRPDGALVVEWGKKRWIALLEVKTGGAPLRADQVNLYLDIARTQGFDAVITISNQITAAPDESPVKTKAPKGVALRHLSWWQIATEAHLQQAHPAVANLDRAWILRELIAYLESGRSGTGGFDDMGPSWVAIRDAAHQKTLRLTTAGLGDVAARWEQLVEFLALELTRDLGRRVTAVWPRELGVAGRLDRHAHSLVESGQFHAALRVPDAVGPLELTSDLWTRRLSTAVSVDAPSTGKPKTRVAWLLRQLDDMPEPVRFEVHYPNVRDAVGCLLIDARAKPERLLLPGDPHREPRSFRLVLGRDLGLKRGSGRGSFVAESSEQTTDFYRSVVQRLRPWRAPAPTLPTPPEEVAGEGDRLDVQSSDTEGQGSPSSDGRDPDLGAQLLG